MFDDEPWHQCPRRPILNDPGYWSETMGMWNLYRKGLLPDRGAVGDQCWRAMTLFRFMDAYFAEAEEAKEAQEARKRRARGG
jgi:hypothetical protein